MRDPRRRLNCAVAFRPDFPSASGLVLWDELKMSVSGLKAELKFLESIFDPNHERFRIIDWKPDELSCQFNVTREKLLIIHCNITVSGGQLRVPPLLRTGLTQPPTTRWNLSGRPYLQLPNKKYLLVFLIHIRRQRNDASNQPGKPTRSQC